MTIIIDSEGRARALRDAKSNPLGRGTVVRGSRVLEHAGLQISEAYAKIYASQPMVYAAVNKLARGVARLPAKTYRDAAGERDYLRASDLDAHPLPVLLSRPFPRGSRFRLFEATVGNLAVYGNACWWKYRPGAGRAPVELWPLDWRHMEFKTGGDEGVEYYEYNGPAGRRRFVPDDVVHFQWWSPAGAAGTSPLEALRMTLVLEDAGRRYAVSSFSNGARPSGAVTTPKTLDPAQRAELRNEIQAMNAGPDAAFRIALMDGGMEWKPFAHTAQEAQTIEHRKFNREEVCSALDIAPPVLHILDHATFSNITEQNISLYRETLGPITTMIEETVGAQLLWGEPDYAGTFIEFDMNEVLKADIEKRAAAYKALETTLSINDRRKLENLKPIGDVGDEQNPANAILVPINHALVMQDGSVVVPSAGTTGSTEEQLAGALAQLVDQAVDGALASRSPSPPATAEPDPALRELAAAVIDLAKATAERPVILQIEEGAIDARTSIEEGALQVVLPARTKTKTKTTIVRDAEGRAAGAEHETEEAIEVG